MNLWIFAAVPIAYYTRKMINQESGGERCGNFQILIVSTVNICKQCLQTASVSGGVGPIDTYQGFVPGPHWGPQTHWAIAPSPPK